MNKECDAIYKSFKRGTVLRLKKMHKEWFDRRFEYEFGRSTSSEFFVITYKTSREYKDRSAKQARYIKEYKVYMKMLAPGSRHKSLQVNMFQLQDCFTAVNEKKAKAIRVLYG